MLQDNDKSEIATAAGVLLRGGQVIGTDDRD